MSTHNLICGKLSCYNGRNLLAFAVYTVSDMYVLFALRNPNDIYPYQIIEIYTNKQKGDVQHSR